MTDKSRSMTFNNTAPPTSALHTSRVSEHTGKNELQDYKSCAIRAFVHVSRVRLPQIFVFHELDQSVLPSEL